MKVWEYNAERRRRMIERGKEREMKEVLFMPSP